MCDVWAHYRFATWETEQKCAQDYGAVVSCFAVMGASPGAGAGGAVAAAACSGRTLEFLDLMFIFFVFF